MGWRLGVSGGFWNGSYPEATEAWNQRWVGIYAPIVHLKRRKWGPPVYFTFEVLNFD